MQALPFRRRGMPTCLHIFHFYFDPNATAVNETYAMAFLALGDNAKENDFYAPFVESDSNSSNQPELHEETLLNYDAMKIVNLNSEINVAHVKTKILQITSLNIF